MMIQTLKDHIKNISGWRTNRKLICFCVDDYGNVRLASASARDALEQRGIRLHGRYDRFDAIDTREDYEQLFEVLQSVRDANGRHAVFTTYALPCTVDYTATLERGEYVPQDLDTTYDQLTADDPSNYSGAYQMLREGIRSNLIRPQFHGREHLNVQVFNALLRKRNPVLMANMEFRCLTAMPGDLHYPNVSLSEAFAFWEKEEMASHVKILSDGMSRFEKVYGYRPTSFTPPSMKLHPALRSVVVGNGILSIHSPRQHAQHLGEGTYIHERNSTGRTKDQAYISLVRNCMFEPSNSDIDWVAYTMNQIRAAFFWNKPALVSSHRVNFCGRIDPGNRQRGLMQLRTLLRKIVDTWPEAEFVCVDEFHSDMGISKVHEL